MDKNPHDFYIIEETIGRGTMGNVKKGTEKSTGRVVAIKEIVLEGSESDSDIDDICKGITFMISNTFPYFVQYYDYYIYEEILYIMLEYLPNRTLIDLIKAGTIGESACAIISREILKALDCIHSKGFVHQNIQASQIFIGENGEVKLSGPEKATILSSKDYVLGGKPYWASPEIIIEESFPCKMDIWSLGITIIELLFGYPPFHDESSLRALFLIVKTDPPRLEGNSFSENFKDFVASCLTKECAERPTAKQLLNHPFILQAGDISCIKSLLHFHSEFKSVVIGLESDFDDYSDYSDSDEYSDDFDDSDEEN